MRLIDNNRARCAEAFFTASDAPRIGARLFNSARGLWLLLLAFALARGPRWANGRDDGPPLSIAVDRP
jgi:hypothetical protein